MLHGKLYYKLFPSNKALYLMLVLVVFDNEMWANMTPEMGHNMSRTYHTYQEVAYSYKLFDK